MRSIPLIRCLPKMSPSSSTSTGSQIAIWRRSLTWMMNTSRLQLRSTITVDGKDVRLITCVSLNPAQHDILPHRQSQLSDLTAWTIRLHITTSLKSISQKRRLYHIIFKWSFWPVQFNPSISNNNVTWPIVLCPHWSNCLQLISVVIIHKYVNIQTSVVGPQ